MPLTNHTPEPLTAIGLMAAVTGLGGYLRRRFRLDSQCAVNTPAEATGAPGGGG